MERGRESHAGGSSVKFALGATDNTELVRWIMRGRRGGLDRFPFNSPRHATRGEEGALSLSLSPCFPEFVRNFVLEDLNNIPRSIVVAGDVIGIRVWA